MSVLLRAMLKKQLLEMTAFLRRNAATGRSRTGWRVIGFGALMVLVLLTVAGSVGLLAWLVCVPLTQAGLDWLYFVLLLVPAWLVGVMGGAFAAYGELYRPRDNELLLSLPIPPGMILAVRMGCVWLTGTGYLAVILVPAYGVYLLFGAHPWSAALALVPVTVFLGCLVLAAACLAGWAAALLGERITRFKPLFSLLYAVLVLGFAFGAHLGIQQGMIWLMTHLDSFAGGLRADAWVLYLLGQAAVGDLPALAVLGAVSLAVLGAVGLVLRRSYLRLMTTHRGARRSASRAGAIRAHSLRRALLEREFRRLGSCTSYLVNGMLASLFLPAMGAAALWKAGQLSAMLAMLPAGYGPALGCAGVCAAASMNLLTPPSVSLEGKTLWLLQSLPVTPWQALRAKLDLHLACTLPPAAFAMLCLLWVTGGSFGEGVLALLGAGLYVLFSGAMGLVFGLRLPNLHWTNETAAVKGGAAPVLTLFAGWGVLMVLCLIWWGMQSVLGAAGALAVCCGLLGAGCAALLAWLRRGGCTLFAQM